MPDDDTREDTIINIFIGAAVYIIRRKRDPINTIYLSIRFTIPIEFILIACGKKKSLLALVRQKVCPRLTLALREFQ